MPRCAFLSMDALGEYVSDDALAIPPLQAQGWDVDTLSWRANGVRWSDYDIVVIRSTWDYFHAPAEFLTFLAQIHAQTRLLNPLQVVRWNARKDYLRELEAKGVAAVPTVWGSQAAAPDLAALHARLGDDIVLKPLVSGGALDTYRLQPGSPAGSHAASALRGREWLAQPYLSAIASEGEYSLVYFDGVHSHSILKTPASGDFRVQEHYGGTFREVQPEPAMLDCARRALATVDASLLYARVDLVRSGAEFVLMELELIEPSLYFRWAPAGAERFAAALDRMARQPRR